ncbi:MAG TPA: type II toxin-antitoxin system RelE/ParE family toxin [Tepidisphaeraceae bacterium]|nr:type II toxin-antitoxin system RelE/ParE family toxin [Tepidisphaeraceae bacterium]
MSVRQFLLTRQAERDLVEIIEYLTAESIDAAIRVRDAFDATFSKLAQSPGIGHYREELLDQRHRFFAVYSYLVVYRWQPRPIQVIAIIHGARDLPVVFGERDLS